MTSEFHRVVFGFVAGSTFVLALWVGQEGYSWVAFMLVVMCVDSLRRAFKSVPVPPEAPNEDS